MPPRNGWYVRPMRTPNEGPISSLPCQRPREWQIVPPAVWQSRGLDTCPTRKGSVRPNSSAAAQGGGSVDHLPRMSAPGSNGEHASTSFQLALGSARLPTLAINPGEDRTFVIEAVKLAEALESDSILTPASLTVSLHGRYPDAVVQERDLAGERSRLWYIYRDGRWVPPDQTRRAGRPARLGVRDRGGSGQSADRL